MSNWPNSWRPSAPTYNAGSGSQEQSGSRGGNYEGFAFPPGVIPPPAGDAPTKPKPSTKPPKPPRLPPRLPPALGAALGGMRGPGRRILMGAARLHPVGRVASVVLNLYDFAQMIKPQPAKPAHWDSNGWELIQECGHAPQQNIAWKTSAYQQDCAIVSTPKSVSRWEDPVVSPAVLKGPALRTYWTQWWEKHRSYGVGVYKNYARVQLASYWRYIAPAGQPDEHPPVPVFREATPARRGAYVPEPRKAWAGSPNPQPGLIPAIDPLVKPGQENPDPLPMPYRAIPYRKPNPWRSPVEQPDRGPVPMPGIAPRPVPTPFPEPYKEPIREIEIPVTLPGAVVLTPAPTVTKPGPAPGKDTKPETGTNKPVLDRTKYPLPAPKTQPAVMRYAPRTNPVKQGVKERKVRISVGRTILAVVGHVGEGMDLVQILWDALPDHVKPGYKLICRKQGCAYEKVWNASAWQRVKTVYEHWDKVNLEQALRGYIYNAIEDRFYGEIGQRLGQAGAQMGKPVGLGTGTWDTVMQEHTAWTYDPTTGRWTDPLEHIR